MVEGPFPEHTNRSKSPSPNILHPKVRSNPAARVFADDQAAFGTAPDFPYVATTYRLTEHFHFWTKHALINAILQPQEFIEIGEVLAKEKGIAQGGWGAGGLQARVRRVQGLCDQAHPPADGGWQADSRDRACRGNWGFTGQARKGYGANTLTPSVGDANTQTPEFKAFLVNVEPTSTPVA